MERFGRNPRRFRGLPSAALAEGTSVPVASTRLARLLGLALLGPEAVGGLLIPSCRAVHTFGMRFPLDLHFLDAQGVEVSVRLAVPPGRFACDRRACAVLELPSEGGRA